MFLRILVLGLGILCCACSQQNYRFVQNIRESNTRPEFIVSVSSTQGNTGSDRLCVEIHQGTLWRSGDSSSTLGQYLAHNTQIAVDDQAVSHDEMTIFSYMTDTIGFDEEGHGAGSYGGDMQFCFDAGYLGAGWHSVSIDTTATDGTAYSYAWEVEIVNSSTPRPTLAMPTPAILPSPIP